MGSFKAKLRNFCALKFCENFTKRNFAANPNLSVFLSAMFARHICPHVDHKAGIQKMAHDLLSGLIRYLSHKSSDPAAHDHVIFHPAAGGRSGPLAAAGQNSTAPAEKMIRYGIWVSSLFFLACGTVLAIVNIIATLINVAHNPVRSVQNVELMSLLRD